MCGEFCALPTKRRKRDAPSHISDGFNHTALPTVHMRPYTVPRKPKDLEAFHEFIVNEYNNADVYVQHGNIRGLHWGSSSEFSPFKELKRTFALEGLTGCTSLIVISRKGAWVSHLWEQAMLNFRGKYVTSFYEAGRDIDVYDRTGVEDKSDWWEYKSRVSSTSDDQS